MRKTLTALLLVIPFLSVAKLGLSLNANYSKPSFSSEKWVWPGNVPRSTVGATARFFISVNVLDAGIGIEYTGFRSVGKIVKVDNPLGFSLERLKVYTGARGFLPNIYANIKLKVLPGVKVYCGGIAGRFYLKKELSQVTAATDPIFKKPVTILLKEAKAVNLLGAQAGIIVKINESTYLNLEASARRMSFKTITDYAYNYIYHYIAAGYPVTSVVWYMPVHVGIEVML